MHSTGVLYLSAVQLVINMNVESKILTGDALELLLQMPKGSVGLCLTDLPYGVTKCDWDRLIPRAPMWKALRHAMRRDRAILLFQTGLAMADLMLSNRRNYRMKYVWEKNRSTNPQHAKLQPLRNFEEIAVFSFGKLPYFPQRTYGHKRSNPSRTVAGSSNIFRRVNTSVYEGGDTSRYPQAIIKFDGVDNDAPDRFHPNQKPVALLQYLIRQHSKPGDVVLDFCCGSGSAGVAALLEKRDFIGIDLLAENTEHTTWWMNRARGSNVDVPFDMSLVEHPLFHKQGA